MSLYSTAATTKSPFTFYRDFPIWVNVLLVYIAVVTLLNAVPSLYHQLALSRPLSGLLAVALLVLFALKKHTVFLYYLALVSLMEILACVTATETTGWLQYGDPFPPIYRPYTYLVSNKYLVFLGGLEIIPYAFIPLEKDISSATVQRVMLLFQSATLIGFYAYLIFNAKKKIPNA